MRPPGGAAVPCARRLARQLRPLSTGAAPLSPAASLQDGSALALSPSGAPGQQAPDPERERRRQFFVPAYERLVTLIRGRVRWAPRRDAGAGAFGR
jgi:hypothetical protein